MSWTHWFSALFVGSVIFIVLFSALFTNLGVGIGDGIWQGLYYWLHQQQVARGGQPWYYYFLLVPFYEQIGLVFGLVGIVRSLRHPSHFRLFLIYWFLGTVIIYSWASEKMPWLVIHMVMPMILLAAIGLEPVIAVIITLIMELKRRKIGVKNTKYRIQSVEWQKPKRVAIIGTIVALFLLILTLQNMFQVTYVHYADGPHEMMIYVQSTLDINTVMGKIDRLDQRFYQGRHKLKIGVMTDASWPFYWYLRDYTNVCYGFPTGCANAHPGAIIAGGENLDKSQARYTASAGMGKSSDYLFHRYALRSWWDEGYKPRPCVASVTDSCQGQPTWGGVGPLLWLSYGDTPPMNAQFNPGLAARNVWNWWWLRKPFGSTAGATDMGLFIRSDLGVNP
jgi:predicted membrane-bound mannosyltransferase